MNQPGLFDAPYPASPGYKAHGTSRAAAESVKPRAATLRDKALALLKDASLTADEVAAKLGETVLAIRPRITELKRMGEIEDTGRVRRNASGVMASVWKIASGPPR